MHKQEIKEQAIELIGQQIIDSGYTSGRQSIGDNIRKNNKI